MLTKHNINVVFLFTIGARMLQVVLQDLQKAPQKAPKRPLFWPFIDGFLQSFVLFIQFFSHQIVSCAHTRVHARAFYYICNRSPPRRFCQNRFICNFIPSNMYFYSIYSFSASQIKGLELCLHITKLQKGNFYTTISSFFAKTVDFWCQEML